MIKILIAAFAWILLGAVMYCVVIGRTIVKLARVDPDSDRVEKLYMEVISIASFGTFPKSYTNDELKRDLEKTTGIPYPLLLLRDLALWPDTLAKVAPRFDEAVEVIKDEYDRGLRVRKEEKAP